MNRSCKNLWGAIVELAEGKTQQVASQHIQQCAECNQKYQGLVRLFSGLALPQFEAPQDLVMRAKSLMQSKSVPMRLIRTSLNLSGARSTNHDFQAVFGAEDIEVRILYSQSGRQWEILAKAPDESWTITRRDEQLSLDTEGRFHFLTPSLDDSSFVLEGIQLKLEIPNISEVLRESGPDS